MDISMRLKTMANMVDKCCCCADIGTDHGYIPIYLIKKGICDKAIASDINKGPCNKAKKNIKKEELEDKIECRIGGGLTTIKVGEANVAVIAGMGGNLIRDIIEESIEVFKNLDYVIVQPVQNPEVLREYIYSKGYTIIEEELCFEEEKYYEIMKIAYDNKIEKVDSIFYEVSYYLVKNNHPLIKEFTLNKINKYNKVLDYIKEDTEGAKIKKDEINKKICKLKELIACL
ncbi:class I SAM-dependent methyltransferase [Clostridium sp. MSJ-11]|uniref:Class I SAM-dependent methyltransferase n=1 Tax=Clostridium mobile TaxID=2841512 RepID=A0ABS6EER6_9CLOT|nr:class I SAM-dependent methyltransferase [Clostridium mobile]MBU5483500.1 class I SAM-dependent methyltransferase [Clostridium mobile]